MSNIKIITNNYKDYPIDEKVIEEMVDGFVKYHKSIYKNEYDEVFTTKYYTNLLNNTLKGNTSKMDTILCFVYDSKVKKVIGFIEGQKVQDTTNKKWSIGSIYVQKNYRNKGVSRALHEKFKIEAAKKGGRFIELDVYAQNEEALRFYKKSGYLISPKYQEYQKNQNKSLIFESLERFIEHKKERETLGRELVPLFMQI